MAKYDEKKQKREKERQKLQKKQNRKANAAGAASYWLLAPLIFVLSFVPLVVYGHEYNTNLGGYSWYGASDIQVDLFRYNKMLLIILSCIYMLAVLGYVFFRSQKKLPWHRFIIPLVIYCVLSLISSIISETSYFSFHGIFQQFEPVWLLMGYCLLAYYAYVFVQTEESIRKISKWFVLGIIVMVIIGLMQGMGHDPFRIPWLMNFITGTEGQDTQVNYPAMGNEVYLTLANSNYVGVYTVMIIPFLLGLVFASKKIWQRVTLFLLTMACFYLLLVSNSKTGFIFLPVTCIITSMLFHKAKEKKWKYIKIGFVTTSILLTGIVLWNKKDLVTHIVNSAKTEIDQSLQSIETKKDCVRIKYCDEEFEFSYVPEDIDSGGIRVLDEQGGKIEAVYDESTYSYSIHTQKASLRYAIETTENFNGFYVQIGSNKWRFSNQMTPGDYSYYAYINDKMVKVEKCTDGYNKFLQRHGSLMSGRGFIWAATLPMIRNHILFGVGPDSYLVHFPNGDWAAKFNVGCIEEMTNRPHNLYLQIAVQTGVPSLLCLFAFFAWYLVDSIRIYRRINEYSYLAKVGIGIAGSVIGFLLMGLTNDSMNGVTPIFYILIGIGIAINQNIKTEQLLLEKEGQKHT